MGRKDNIPIISPNLDDLLIIFLGLLLIPSMIIAHFISFNSFLVYVLLIVSFLGIFIFGSITIEKAGKQYHSSKGLGLFIIILLAPSAIIAGLTQLSFILVYAVLIISFFAALIYMAKKGRLVVK